MNLLMKARSTLQQLFRSDAQDEALRDRVAGAMLGMAAGDALGAHYEFGEPWAQGEPRRAVMLGGGAFGWEVGEWTDDTSMAICIASWALTPGKDLTDIFIQDKIVNSWVSWAQVSKDVGAQTRSVLNTVYGLSREEAPHSSQVAQKAAQTLHERTGRSGGNGSLMRTAPVALAYIEQDDPAPLARAAKQLSALTHYDPDAGEACAIWCAAIKSAVLTGKLSIRQGVLNADLTPDRVEIWMERVADAENCSPAAFKNNGWVVEAFQAAWSAIHYTQGDPEPLRAGLVCAVEGGGDTDTVAAIAGALLGAAYGASAVPQEWRSVLHGWPRLTGDELSTLALQVYDNHA